MEYGIANNLVGFVHSSLRVRIERRDGDNVWVRTADLLDSGTPLVLSAHQVVSEAPAQEAVRHKSGLVTFAA